MKKILNTVVSGLLIGAALGMAGCMNLGGGETPSSPDYASQTNVFENGWYILADFESYQQCVQFGQGGYFGKVIQTNDYVTHGNQSARLEVHGYSYMWGYVSPSLNLSTVNDYFQKRDFSDCDMYAFDMYSVMDYDLTIQFKVVGTDGTIGLKTLTIKPGWNYVQIERIEFGARWSDEVSSFSFVFEKGNLHEETQTMYIDNFRARKIVD